ncbi:hypothetical protein [Halorubrum coriense]|uniref:hypothetical protein n=1 Tax=Halorubrum coriense TaxID=64713 RepID=UPI0012681639|nr:hypothetical protein [Halorubrum coriense]
MAPSQKQLEIETHDFGIASQIRVGLESIDHQWVIEIDSFEKVDKRTTILKLIYRNFDFHLSVIDRAPKAVPLDVAVEGKPALVGFLYSFGGMNKSEIAQRVSIDPQTVEQYLTDIKHGRRILQ